MCLTKARKGAIPVPLPIRMTLASNSSGTSNGIPKGPAEGE